MVRMRKLLAEFKAIAIGGNVLDLALGFIIGTAFATLIQSFVTNIFLQLVAAIAGKRDFQALVVNIADTPIRYGQFLNDLLQFVLLTQIFARLWQRASSVAWYANYAEEHPAAVVEFTTPHPAEIGEVPGASVPAAEPTPPVPPPPEPTGYSS